MALNPVNPIQSASATATNGSPTISVTGGVDCSFIVPGFILQLGTRRIVSAISGTAPVSGTSTITLAANWDQPTTTDVLIGWNSYESLPNIINRIQNALGQQTAIGELTTNGLIEKTGANAYQTVTITAFGKSLIDDADAAAARTTLGAQPLDATLTAVAGVNTAANKIIYFTGVDAAASADLSAFGRSVIAGADAAAVNALLGVQSKATVDLVAQLFQRAALDLNFATNRHNVYGAFGPELTALTTAITTTRNSTATYQSPTVIASAAVNAPRITYDAANGNALGLLCEEQRTNLLLQSEALGNAPWQNINTTVTANNTDAPDNAATADKVVENTVNSTHPIRQVVTFAASTTYTFSAYFKASERSAVTMLVSASAVASWHINLLTGVISKGSVALESTAEIVTTMNGWYRVSITFTTTVSATGYVDFRLSNVWPVPSSSGTSYTGDGTSGLFVWGTQLEVGSFQTSYIPTTTAQVTRVADVISRALTTTNANAGAIFIEFDLTSYYKTSGQAAIAKLVDSSNSGNSGFALVLNNNIYSAYIRNALSSGSISVAVADSLLPVKALVSFDNATLKLLVAIGGVTNEITLGSAIDISGFVSHLFVSGASGMAGTFTTHSKTVKRCTYFPRSFTVAEAQAITA